MKIDYDGRIVDVPDDSTDEEISAMLASIGDEAPSATSGVDDAVKRAVASASNEVRSAVGTKPRSDFRNPVFEVAGAVAEPLASIATSVAAKPISELAALAVIPAGIAATELGYPDAVDPTAVKESIFDTLRHNPKTALGSSEYNPINYAMSALGSGMDRAAEYAVRRMPDSGETLGVDNKNWKAGAKEALLQTAGLLTTKGALGSGRSVVDKIFGVSDRQARNIALKSLEPTMPETVRTTNPLTGVTTTVINEGPALRNIRNAATGRANNQTAAEAAGLEASSQFAALEQLARESSPDLFGNSKTHGSDITTRQDARMNAPVPKLAGGVSQEAAIAAQSSAKGVLNETLDPLRQDVMDAANKTHLELNPLNRRLDASLRNLRQLEDSAKSLKTDQRRSLSSPMMHTPNYAAKAEDASKSIIAAIKDPVAISSMIESKIGDLSRNNLTRLKSDTVLSNIRRRLNTPGIGASSLVERVLTKVDKKIRKMSESNGGTLDARDLHTIRKYELNSIIEKYSKDMSASDKQLAIQEMQGVKKSIDRAIVEAAGNEGPKWKSYMNRYSLGMRDIGRQEFARQFDRMSDADKIDVAKGNLPEKVEEIFGKGNTELSANLGQQAEVYRNIGRKLETRQLVKDRSKIAGKALQTTIKDNISAFYRLPNLLNTKVAVANKILEVAESGVTGKVMRKLADAMQSPQEFIKLIDRLPPSERSALLKKLDTTEAAFTANQGMMTGAQDQ